MNDSHDPERDKCADRLMDQALRELLGRETPPDHTNAILKAAEHRPVVASEKRDAPNSKPGRRWLVRVVDVSAVLAVIGAAIMLTLPAVHSAREAARRVQNANSPSPFFDNMGWYTDRWDTDLERGPGRGGDRYDRLLENQFRSVKDTPLSTFSVDVDTASYANVRRFILQDRQLPPRDAVRIEELINYFQYEYAQPADDAPLAVHLAATRCPWQPDHRLVRVALKAKEIPLDDRPPCNLVFLLDVSGSMNSPDKLPLLKSGMRMLTRQLRADDRVAIVVYAGTEGLVLPSTPGGRQEEILAALDQLESGGSTNGGAGIELAYRVAQDNAISPGVNRVVLCTDGDFNVGTTSAEALAHMVEEKAKAGVLLSVLGFGRGNLNDAMMETTSNQGNGNYAYVDSDHEARRTLVAQLGATLITVAKDVKLQVEFNPAQVASYRLIGYENRILAAEDFNDDRRDAGDVGAGHCVTALYEVVPVGRPVDRLKYQPSPPRGHDSPVQNELLTVKLRYKEPTGETSQFREYPLKDDGGDLDVTDSDFQFAAAVASFGMLLRDSEHKGNATYHSVLDLATAAQGRDTQGDRDEFLTIVRQAGALHRDRARESD